ncbi:Cytochrome c oxidase assembly protein cox11, mitochondrial [Coemansia spiralis]|nr:Cytochrome c oxidase assembly protein cox11, mitochondrial [Coemansia spiralis]
MASRVVAALRGTGFGAARRASGWRAGELRAPAARRWGSSQPGSGQAHSAKVEFERFHAAARERNVSGILYVGAFVIFFVGASYAAVPLYRLLCKRTGFMGTPKTEQVVLDPETLRPLEGHRKLRIKFSSQVSTALDWSFRPEQRHVTVVPGESALAFFKAYNNSDKPIIGIATYNVIPDQAAQYFNKIQCFCFDEQQLDPKEDIDMPVFFFIDPEFADDPLMDDIDTITLSYTFFKASGR